MGFLYKDRDDITYSVELTKRDDGMIVLMFSCDGGKFGTDEIVGDFYFANTKELLSVLYNHHSPDDNKHPEDME